MKKPSLLMALTVLGLMGVDPAAAVTPDEASKAAAGSHVNQHVEQRGSTLSGNVTLQQVLAATLRDSPRLAAFSWEVRSREARAIQAGLRPNPELSISPENFVGSGDFGGQVQYQNTLQLSQLVELGDKRQLRSKAAAMELNKTRVEYESTRVEILGNATIDFIEVISSQEEVRLGKLALDQAEGLTKAVERRIKASVGSPLEAKRATILAARAEIALARADRVLRSAKQKLAANWGGSGADIASAAGDVFTTHSIPPLKALLERIEASPDHRIAIADEKVRAAEAALARSRRVSDVVVSGAWRHGRDWDDQTAVAGVSFPLMIFDRAQGDIASFESQVEKSKVETASVEVRLRAVVFGLYQEIVQAKDETESMAREIVPRTEEAVALAKSGFAQGLYSQLELLDAQRTLVEVRREHIQAGARYHRLIAEVEKLLGTSL